MSVYPDDYLRDRPHDRRPGKGERVICEIYCERKASKIHG